MQYYVVSKIKVFPLTQQLTGIANKKMLYIYNVISLVVNVISDECTKCSLMSDKNKR